MKYGVVKKLIGATVVASMLFCYPANSITAFAAEKKVQEDSGLAVAQDVPQGEAPAVTSGQNPEDTQESGESTADSSAESGNTDSSGTSDDGGSTDNSGTSDDSGNTDDSGNSDDSGSTDDSGNSDESGNTDDSGTVENPEGGDKSTDTAPDDSSRPVLPDDSSSSDSLPDAGKDESKTESTPEAPKDESTGKKAADASVAEKTESKAESKTESQSTDSSTATTRSASTYVPSTTNIYSSSLAKSIKVISSATRQEMVRFAMQYLTEISGVPYVWGGESLETGVDCSGFMQQIYGHFGIDIPRTSSEQAESSKRIDISEAKPGDLVFKARDGVVYHVMMVVENDTASKTIKVVEARGAAWGIVMGEFDYDDIYCAGRFMDDKDWTSTKASDLIKTGAQAAKGDEDARNEIIEKLAASCAREWSESGFAPSVMIAEIIEGTNWMSFNDTDADVSASDNRVVSIPDDSKHDEPEKKRTDETVSSSDDKKDEIISDVLSGNNKDACAADALYQMSETFLDGDTPEDTTVEDSLFDVSVFFASEGTSKSRIEGFKQDGGEPSESAVEKLYRASESFSESSTEPLANELFLHSASSNIIRTSDAHNKGSLAEELFLRSASDIKAGQAVVTQIKNAEENTPVTASNLSSRINEVLNTAEKDRQAGKFTDIESCMEAYAESFISENPVLKNSKDYKAVVKALSFRTDTYKKRITDLIEEYELAKYDIMDLTGIGSVDGSNYTQNEMELLWAIVAQEDDTSYEGALAVITSAMNRADVNYGGYGKTALEQLTAPGQYCYSELVSPAYLWQKRLDGNVPEFVKTAVEDCIHNGKRNHEFKNFRSTYASGRVQFGSNWFF